MRRQAPLEPQLRALSTDHDYSSLKTITSHHHSRRTSISHASNNLNQLASRRSSLLLHRRHQTLLKITEENFALLDRINTQKAVIKFTKDEAKQPPPFKIINFFKNKENIDTRHLDIIIAKKKGEIDKALRDRPTPKVLYF